MVLQYFHRSRSFPLCAKCSNFIGNAVNLLRQVMNISIKSFISNSSCLYCKMSMSYFGEKSWKREKLKATSCYAQNHSEKIHRISIVRNRVFLTIAFSMCFVINLFAGIIIDLRTCRRYLLFRCLGL